MRSYLWVLEWVLELIMAGEKILTDAQCKAAKPKQKIYYLNDGNGLRLRVQWNHPDLSGCALRVGCKVEGY